MINTNYILPFSILLLLIKQNQLVYIKNIQCERRMIDYSDNKSMYQAPKSTNIIIRSHKNGSMNNFDATQLSKIRQNTKYQSNLKTFILIDLTPLQKEIAMKNIHFAQLIFKRFSLDAKEFNLNNFIKDLEKFSRFFPLYSIYLKKLEAESILSYELPPNQFDSINIPIMEDYYEFELVDFVNMMAFDYYSRWNHYDLSLAAPFAPIYPYKKVDILNANSTIQNLACNIAKKQMNKINLALSFTIWNWKRRNVDIDEIADYLSDEQNYKLQKEKFLFKEAMRSVLLIHLYENTLSNATLSNFNKTCDSNSIQIEDDNFKCDTIDETTIKKMLFLIENIPLENKLMIIALILMILLFKLIIFFIIFERRREKNKLENIISQLQPYKDYSFETMEWLGKGNFGEVRLGKFYHKMELGDGHMKTVAYKIMKENYVKITVMKEISVMITLYHENICKIYGLHVLEGKICILMEYANLGDLQKYLQDRRPGAQNPPALLTSELLNISAMIAKGLRYLEGKRILHRDLAARNCLVSGKDDHGIVSANMRPPIRVMLSDFGLSKILKENNSFYQPVLPCCSMSEPMQPHLPLLHQFGREELAWRYQAPECHKSSKFTFKSEIWSFGMVLFEVFTCEPPFVMFDEETVIKMIRKGEHPEIPPNLPDEIDEIMRKCWLMDPKERISIGEICEILGV